MYDPLGSSNYESPMFLNMTRNPSPEQASGELSRLVDQQTWLKKKIATVKGSKEKIGAQMIRNRNSSDFSNMQDALNGEVNDYYRLQEQLQGLDGEIGRLRSIVGDFSNAVGDNPVSFDWIGSQILRCIPMTGIHSTVPHGLVVGDKISVTAQAGNWTLSGVYGVQEIKDVDDGSYAGELIVIHQLMYAGLSTASGYWQKVPKDMPTTPYVGTVTGCCPEGQHRINPYTNQCVPDSCPEGQELVGDVCLPKCPQGYWRDPTTKQCEPDTSPCPVGQHKNDYYVCVDDNCPTGQHWDVGQKKCVANDVTCPEGQELFNGKCVPKCPTGYKRNSYGICYLDSCPEGQELLNGKCVPKCLIGFKRDSDGKCVAKTVNTMGIELPVWSLWVGGVLVAGLIGFNIYRAMRK